LLLRARTNTNGCKELPDIDVFASVDRTWEDVGEGRLENIEKSVVGGNPIRCK
jgi:hypothetical protein